MLKSYTIKINYFKPSGKWYTDTTMEMEQKIGGEGESCYMPDVVDTIRRLWRNSKLPGLGSGSWDGYILVDCEDGYPCLILPETP